MSGETKVANNLALHKILVRIRRNVAYVEMGLTISDKLRILLFQLLRTPPRMFGYHSRAYWLFLKKSTRLLRGATVHVNESTFRILDFDCLNVLSSGTETFMQHWFTPRKGDVVVDIGAHVGRYSVLSAKAVGDEGKVIAIEPDKTNYELLLTNLLLNDANNVVVLNIAAWNSESNVKLYRGAMSGLHSVRERSDLGFTYVTARPICRVLEELGVDHVEWVKVDVEGAELEVLEGLSSASSHIQNIVVEVSARNIEQVKDLARRLDYHLIAISPTYGDKSYFLLSR
jgi:FkbM family methyltransferase